MLAAVVVMTALVLIALAVAAPVVARQLQRDKEVESEHRAEQYVRAIRLYYRKTGAYPPSIDALKQSNNIRYLRQEYVDPLTGKANWRLIHQGEQKTKIKVFFGQELGGLPGVGLGASGTGGSTLGSPVGGTSSTATIGATSALSSGFQDASITTTTGASGATGGTGGLGGGSGSGSGAGGGGPIVGVGTSATGNSILTPNKQKTYETWEFWYDPRIEQLYQKGRMNGGIGSSTGSSQSASSFGSTPGSPVGSSNLPGFGQNGAGTNATTNTTPGTSTTSPSSSASPQ